MAERYFKVLNEQECHHGLQYTTGLNTDPIPLYAGLSGKDAAQSECSPGGMYFTKAKNILLFCSYGVWVREVTLPDNQKVHTEPFKLKADKIILGERMPLTNSATIAKLIEAGADVNVKDGTGWTPLHHAAYHGNTDMARALIEAGADKEATNLMGRTPLWWAQTNNHHGVVNLLTEKEGE